MTIYKEDITNDDFEDVNATASMAHYGQKRRGGKEYMTHPSEVSSIVKKFYPSDKISAVVALLHDSMEDAPSNGTVKDIDEMKTFIRGSIGDEQTAEEVINAVESLTHDKDTQPDYGAYVQTILGNKIALRVKLADMLHNISDGASEKQKKKYSDALKKIAAISGGVPKSISPHHWRALEQASGTSLMQRESKTMTKTQLKEHIRKVIREQLDTFGDGNDIKTKIESFVGKWIESNISLVQQVLEELAIDDQTTPPSGTEVREMLFDSMIADASDIEIVKALSQNQDSVNEIVDRLFSKIVDKEWATAVSVVGSNQADSMESRYGHEMDPYFTKGLSRDDF